VAYRISGALLAFGTRPASAAAVDFPTTASPGGGKCPLPNFYRFRLSQSALLRSPSTSMACRLLQRIKQKVGDLLLDENMDLHLSTSMLD